MPAALLFADMGWGNHMGDWGAGWWILMAVLMVAFWALVIVGAVWLVRSLWSPAGRPPKSAIEVLDHRLASGEISPEEYRQRRELLDGGKPGGDSR
jgi:putative membrane protein